MIDEKILNHVLAFGPFKGKTIGQAADLVLPDGSWAIQRMQEGILNPSKGVNWMSWYLSHHCQGIAKGHDVPPDRNEIAAFLVAYRKCYQVEPYKTWANKI